MIYVEVFVLTLAICRSGGQKMIPRVIEGESDYDERYPYVGAFIGYLTRMCTGSIITPEWVLTAGHCLPMEEEEIKMLTFIYGKNLHQVDYLTRKRRKSRVLHGITPYYDQLGERLKNDIALAMIETVNLKKYGKVSSLDYKSLVGYAVEYAGAGGTFSEDVKNNQKLLWKAIIKDETRPLQIGYGVVAKCTTHPITPAICIRPKCTAKKQRIQSGDSGGPLFYRGKIIAVASGGENLLTEIVLTQFTPVSPYLDWIKDSVTKTEKSD